MAKKKSKPTEPVVQVSDEGKQKALEATLNELTKRYGDGTIIRLGDASNLVVDVIPSGSLTVDIAIGVGGIPRGRITEIYGPESSGKTTLCLHVVAEAQKRGGICAFVDMEHALDPAYAERIGVDIDTLYISQPDTGEQALEITEALVRSGAVDVVVVDSVAALVPRAEIEGEMGDSHVGLQARLMSQALRKLSGAIKQSNTTVLFTNQLREKIGVMFGCFTYQAPVMLADGRRMPIGKLVNQKINAEVLTYNVKTKTFEPKPIKEWFKNGVPINEFDMTDNEIGKIEDEYFTLVLAYPDGSARTKITCTPNHLILTPDDYQMAEDLDLGDTVIARYDKLCLSYDLEQLLIGSILGDGSLRTGGEYTAYFREMHAPTQTDYIIWKSDSFGGLSTGVYTEKRGNVGFRTTPSTTLAAWKSIFYSEDRRYKRFPTHILNTLSPLALAVWYQDDGTRNYQNDSRVNEIALRKTTPEEKEDIRRAFANRFGLQVKVVARGNWTTIRFSGDESDKFEQIIAPYVHPSMIKKLRTNHDLCGTALAELDFHHKFDMDVMPCRIVEIRRQLRNGKHALRYNLEIDGNHNYLVSDVIVHNSPETTSGGRALKFYASVRIDIRRIQSIKQGGEVVGNRTRVRVTKNKVSAPFREGEFDIMFYEHGISKVGEVIDLAAELEIVEKRGAFYRYNDGMLGQGRENSKQFLEENPEIYLEIEDAIRAQYGLPPVATLPTEEAQEE
ncbi:MAG: recombinase RecA [Chloroflexi bacterium]|nr:MAG: recombinase RecA [Chloroflexota bacterium]